MKKESKLFYIIIGICCFGMITNPGLKGLPACIPIAILFGYRFLRRRSHVLASLYRPWVYRLWNKFQFLGLLLNSPHWLVIYWGVYVVIYPVMIVVTLVSALFGIIELEELRGVFTPLVTVLLYGGLLTVGFSKMLDMNLIKRIIHYADTEYYKQTRHPRKKVLTDKGLWGEFLAYLELDQMQSHCRFVMNPIIPKANGTDFTEIDLICVAQDGIHVVEAKNRGGVLEGNAQNNKWKQYIGQQEHELHNPVLQNQNHVIVLYNHILHEYCVKKSQGETCDYLKKAMNAVNFYNLVFIADYTTDVRCSGILPTCGNIFYPLDLGDFAKSTGETVLSAEEVDQLADFLMLATKVSKQDREFLFQAREDQWQAGQREKSFYFVRVNCGCELYRYDGLGISKLGENGYWMPPRVLGVEYFGTWVNRLPYCDQDGYMDYTSYQQAYSLYERILRYLNAHDFGLYEYAHMDQILRDAFPNKNDIFYV